MHKELLTEVTFFIFIPFFYRDFYRVDYKSSDFVWMWERGGKMMCLFRQLSPPICSPLSSAEFTYCRLHRILASPRGITSKTCQGAGVSIDLLWASRQFACGMLAVFLLTFCVERMQAPCARRCDFTEMQPATLWIGHSSLHVEKIICCDLVVSDRCIS